MSGPSVADIAGEQPTLCGAAPSLTRNFTWTFAGNVVYAACQWAILILIAKLGTAEMMGQFAYALALTAPIVLFANLQLRAVLATDARSEFSFKTYLGMRVLTCTTAFALIAIVAFVATHNRFTAFVVIAVGLAKVIESISDLLYGCLQQQQQMSRIAKSMICKGTLSATAFGLAIYFTHSILASVFAMAGMWASVVIFYDFPNCIRLLSGSKHGVNEGLHNVRPVFNKESFIRLVRKAGPLGVAGMLISLSNNLPRYFIEHHLGVRALGIFSAMAYLMTAGNTVANALAEAAIPKLANLYSARKTSAFFRLVRFMFAIGCGMGLSGVAIALLAGPWLLRIMYRAEYAQHSDVFVWLMVAAALGYVGTFLGAAATSTRAFSQFVIPYLVFTAVAAAASRLFIPTFGLVGAAWAVCTVCFASCLVPVVIMITARRERAGADMDGIGLDPHRTDRRSTLYQAKGSIRIAHILGGMQRGGVETWLMHILRSIDVNEFKMDFIVHTESPSAYDEEIRSLGCRILPCLRPARPLSYQRELSRILRQYGPYDVVHSHVHHFSGFTLRTAYDVGVPVRIAHAHNDTRAADREAGLLRRGYLRLMESWIARYATCGLAASHEAAASLYSQKWTADVRWRTLYYGIDVAAFGVPLEGTDARAELGIPSDAIVVGHVGRFVKQKNHSFFLKVARELANGNPKVRFVFVGDGPLRLQIQAEAANVGLASQVLFLGVRSDIVRLMRSAMDVLLFPSLFEGLPLVLLEAQAAGLPAVISDAITNEVDVIKPLIFRRCLSETPQQWAAAVLDAGRLSPSRNRERALLEMVRSPFSIYNSVENLTGLYRQACVRPTPMQSLVAATLGT